MKKILMVLAAICILLPSNLVAAAEKSPGPQWTGVWATNMYGGELRLQQTGEVVYGVLEGSRILGIADAATRTIYGSFYTGSGDGSMGVRSGPLRLTMAADGKSFTGWWDGPDGRKYSGTFVDAAFGKWNGTWETDYGPVWLQSDNRGNTWGGYENNGVKGRLTAKVKGNVLSGTWQEGSEWGLFEFTLAPWGDSFSGWRNTSTSPWTGKLRVSR